MKVYYIFAFFLFSSIIFLVSLVFEIQDWITNQLKIINPHQNNGHKYKTLF